MPLECSHCKERFEVDFTNRLQALRLRQILFEHKKKHPELPIEYNLVDREGIVISDDSNKETLNEEKLLEKVSEWGQ